MATNNGTGQVSSASPFAIDSYESFISVVDAEANKRGFTDHVTWLSQISMAQSHGSKDSIFQDVLYGINHRMRGDYVPSNTDLQGLTFITRPNLNLTYDNISQVRVMTHLLNEDPISFQRAIRVLLDNGMNRPPNIKKVKSKLVDDLFPYIPILSNTITSCSGWPDINGNVYASPEGMAKETWIMNDRRMEIYEQFTLSIGFQNMSGDPISLLFLMWLTYMSGVLTDKMTPYPKNLANNEIDYQTRIYRLVLDRTGKFVQKWASTGISFPTSLNIGQAYNFSRDAPFSTELDQIQIPFASAGAMYNDPITLEEFNMTTWALNEDLMHSVQNGSGRYMPIPNQDTKLLNYHGYPIVDLNTQELQWWVEKETYKKVKEGNIDVL